MLHFQKINPILFPSSETVKELTEVETLFPRKAILHYKNCIYMLLMLLLGMKTVIFMQILGGTEVSTSKNLEFFHSLRAWER